MPLSLAYGLTLPQLYRREGLITLDARFVEYLQDADTALLAALMQARAEPDALSPKQESELLTALAPHVEDFVAKLFAVEAEVETLKKAHLSLNPLYACQRQFVQRRAAKALKEEEAARLNAEEVTRNLAQHMGAWDELRFAETVLGWLEDAESNKAALNAAAAYAAWALYSEEGRRRHRSSVLFTQPKKLDYAQLIEVQTEVRDGVTMLKTAEAHIRPRHGFDLTDPKGSLMQALDEAHYCIYCAYQGRDSCSKGMREKTGEFKQNPLGNTLTGCPLEEHISEMNELKAQGHAIGALAAVTVNNPLCAGTGHRICNDCMKACIYQKQEPVDIPLTETRVLDDVIALPYGVEIYSLLTRWNPLNLRRPLPKAPTGYKVLVVGMGPAGYTLAHHLMNDGHMVVGIDGFKIEPMDEALSGVDANGRHTAFRPVESMEHLRQPLSSRPAGGFGGVAEYGITVRWDKNYLTLIRMLLERRGQFSLIGGVRFGSQLNRKSAFALGFDHIALCMGAGKPTLPVLENGLARGVRTASDFLMGLQLTGAARADSIANLQMRLPVVVIGGGLTAIDAATEALAYYPVQVEKFLARFEALNIEQREAWAGEDAEIAEEFLRHARAIRAERASAANEGRAPDIARLLASWGGATVCYRKRLQDAPSYRLSHEEVEKGLEEGIAFAENLMPVKVELDRYGHARGLQCRDAYLPAKTILLAAGTSPNTVLAREDGAILLDGQWFAAIDAAGNTVSPQRCAKPGMPHVLMHREADGRAVSFFGDLHPSFAGNVVKAMGSAKQGYPVVSQVLQSRHPVSRVAAAQDDAFLAHINTLLRARVHAVNRLTPTIVEVVLHAPLAAEAFQPGQFYRLQNFEAFAAPMDNRHPSTGTLAMESLAMTGAWVDKAKGLVAVIVLEMGGSSDLCAYLKPGEPVVLMGPTGAPSHIPSGDTVLLAGGGLGNAVLFSIGRAMKNAGCRVLYFAGYRNAEDRYKEEEIEAAADVVVWCCDTALFSPNRLQDKAFHGNIVQAMQAYAEGRLGNPVIPMHEVEQILAIGSDRMMQAVAQARRGILKPYLKPTHTAIGSINSPMQCMMKEICAQCLQKHIHPETGTETYVYSCVNQDQCLDKVDFLHLSQRLKQNSAQENLTRRWLRQALTERLDK